MKQTNSFKVFKNMELKVKCYISVTLAGYSNILCTTSNGANKLKSVKTLRNQKYHLSIESKVNLHLLYSTTEYALFFCAPRTFSKTLIDTLKWIVVILDILIANNKKISQ